MPKTSFIKYFNDHVSRVRVVLKRSSLLMKTLSFFMQLGSKLGITKIDSKTFMNDYTTTIGSTIYCNETTVDSEPNTLIVHELCHVLQFKNGCMPLHYIFSPKRRMYYESECVQAEILCYPGVERGVQWMERRVNQFKSYGIKENIIREELNKRITEVKENRAKDRPRKVWRTLYLWRITP